MTRSQVLKQKVQVQICVQTTDGYHTRSKGRVLTAAADEEVFIRYFSPLVLLSSQHYDHHVCALWLLD